MRIFKTIFVLFTAGAAVAGCGDSDNTCGDGGCPDGGGLTSDATAGGDGPMLWGLSRDMQMYNVTKVTIGNDGCGLAPNELLGMAIPSKYDATTNMFSFGKEFGTPAQPAFGSGKVGANMATLTRDNQAGDPAKCYWHQKDVSIMNLFDHDKFTLDVTEDEDMFSAGCTGADAPPAGGSCKTTFQLTLELKK